MKTFLLILIALIISPFALVAAIFMFTAFIELIVALFMFAIPAFFVLVFLALLGWFVETITEKTNGQEINQGKMDSI
jgi:hypothetical protein